MFRANRLVLGALARLARLRRVGREHLPAEGPVLVVANHVAFIDPVLVAVAIFPRRSWSLGKEELLRHRLARAWLLRSGMIPLKRASADVWAIRTARELLARGECLVVFPEGQVTRTGFLRPGFPGAGFLALTPGVTVIPAVVSNVRQRGQRLTVRFGPPIAMDDLRGARGRDANRAATDRIMATVAAMVPSVGGPAQAAPEGDAALVTEPGPSPGAPPG